ncbi:hypothetical protein K439DRAFT_800041 [Ramaria rubella]|nr:hypothetical protein K439DRAFT_800041 [Ramaria rubella]
MAESFTPSPLSSTTFTLHEMYGDGQIKGNTTYDLPDLTHSRLLTPARPNNVKQRTDSLPTKTHRRPPHKTTAAQKRILLAAFEDDPNPPAGKRERLAKQLNVERRIIKNWFSNQRALRRRLGQGYRGYADSFHSGSTSSCSASGSGDELELELEGETRRVGASEVSSFAFIFPLCFDFGLSFN